MHQIACFYVWSLSKSGTVFIYKVDKKRNIMWNEQCEIAYLATLHFLVAALQLCSPLITFKTIYFP